jgi:serine/threonine-protein kinase
MVGRIFLGRYEPIKLLGEGGMGRVYLARQTDLGRQVVVKVMHDHIATDPKFRERFQRETLLMARLQHANIVALFDASLNDPQGPCIVMEYIRGVSLDGLLQRNGRLSPARVSRLLTQLCDALQTAHSEGIIHRDLKPSNIMVVDPDTPYEKIKVMDFGLAKLVADVKGMGMYHKSTETGADFAVGTPGYISPEQVRGDELTLSCDLYSVGVILFELLTGKLPFTREDTMDVLLAHATESPPTFSDLGLDIDIPHAVEMVVHSCLAKNPADRPASARDLAMLFEEALHNHHHHAAADEEQGAEPEAMEKQGATVPKVAPNSKIYELDARMPDTLVTLKLKGFVHDIDGEVLDSVPGRLKVRVGHNGGGWFGGMFRKTPIVDMDLVLERHNPNHPSDLHITIVMTTPDRKAFQSQLWQQRCDHIFIELRSYLGCK